MQSAQGQGRVVTHFRRLSSHDDELVGSLHKETCEFVAEHLLQLVRLFDLDADADRVHRRLDQALLLVCTANGDRIQKELLATSVGPEACGGQRGCGEGAVR